MNSELVCVCVCNVWMCDQILKKRTVIFKCWNHTLISQEENYFGPKDGEKHKLLLTTQTGLSIDFIFTFDLLPLQGSASNLKDHCGFPTHMITWIILLRLPPNFSICNSLRFTIFNNLSASAKSLTDRKSRILRETKYKQNADWIQMKLRLS